VEAEIACELHEVTCDGAAELNVAGAVAVKIGGVDLGFEVAELGGGVVDVVGVVDAAYAIGVGVESVVGAEGVADVVDVETEDVADEAADDVDNGGNEGKETRSKGQLLINHQNFEEMSPSTA